MKKLFAILIALIMALSLAACGNSGKTPSESSNSGTQQNEPPKPENGDASTASPQSSGLAWPSIAYLKDTDKYTGDGKITQVKEWDASAENSMWTVYYDGAAFDSVESYVAGLVEAGWTNHYADEDGNYMEKTTDKGTARAYYCTCDYAEVEIQVADFSNSMSFTDKAEFSFNLSIQFSKS